jgi:hypothetical protein
MAETIRAQIETYLAHLDRLIRRGQQLYDALAADPENPSSIAATRFWREECGVTINQLSGGSKAHWLARSFTEAFLMRSAAGDAVEGAPPQEIVQRLLGVLGQAVATLSQMEDGPAAAAAPEPAPRRFNFVHNAELRPIVEQAYTDSRRALERGDFIAALRISCGILEAIITDALEHKGLQTLEETSAPAKKIADWPFALRVSVAEQAGLIRSGCARLPAIAWRYRDHSDGEAEEIVSEQDAKRAGQVLNVVMRDLDPGR